MYPSTLTSFTNPSPLDRLNSPSHSSIETAQNNALVGLQTFIGVTTGANASAIGTILYDVKAAGSNGGGHVQTANKGGTGQTQYAKGDILVAQSSSVLTKLAVGGNETVLVADSTTATGVKWGAAPTINVQSFVAWTTASTATGVWVKPAAATANSQVFVQLWGGGGSGASAGGSNEAGGGGGGGYIAGWFSASVLASSVLVALGKGGDGVATLPNGSTGDEGIPGTATVFSPAQSILTAYAGGGGASNAVNAGGGGGAGLLNNGSSALDDTGGASGLFGGVGGNGGTNGSIATMVGDASGGGGGGGASGGPSSVAGRGGNSFGGGGGGGVNLSQMGLGGFSGTGAHGRAASIFSNNGSVLAAEPGGGGGASHGGAGNTSGPGGGGKAIITTFL